MWQCIFLLQLDSPQPPPPPITFSWERRVPKSNDSGQILNHKDSANRLRGSEGFCAQGSKGLWRERGSHLGKSKAGIARESQEWDKERQRASAPAPRGEPWSKGSWKGFKQGKNKSKFELQKRFWVRRYHLSTMAMANVTLKKTRGNTAPTRWPRCQCHKDSREKLAKAEKEAGRWRNQVPKAASPRLSDWIKMTMLGNLGGTGQEHIIGVAWNWLFWRSWVFCLFVFNHVAHGTLFPQPGIELALSALEVTTGPPGKSLEYLYHVHAC